MQHWPMHQASKCHAKSKRSGFRCRSPAVRGASVCRMHGAGGGAPARNRNALKHGAFTAETLGLSGVRALPGLFTAALILVAARFVINVAGARVRHMVMLLCLGILFMPIFWFAVTARPSLRSGCPPSWSRTRPRTSAPT